MSDALKRYRELDYPLPETYLSWDLFGAGLENLGRDGKPVELPLREPRDDEVLLRVDALGLCFSDTKLIWAGNEHPRIRGRDLEADPTVPGHEAALTVVQAGADWKNRFAPGQRFIVQADVFIGGEQKAYGYVQRGAMAQFTYAGPWLLDGDDGCYLLPLKESTGYAEAALVEPWACVEAAYEIRQRPGPLPGGRILIVFAGGRSLDLGGLYEGEDAPRCAVCLGECTVDLTPILGDVGLVSRPAPTAERIADVVHTETGGEGFDDVVLVGPASTELVRACDAALAKNGVLAFVGSGFPAAASFDIGRIHYHFTRHVGTTGTRLKDAYLANPRSDLLPGGTAWMIGAAGPMGQMHVQRALELPQPPGKVYASDIAPERLEYMMSRLGPVARERGVELLSRDVTDPSGFDDDLRAFSGGAFDDVVVMAPVAKLVEHGAGFVGDKGVLNIFAGVALGTQATLPVGLFPEKHARVLGSSGSSMDDIRNVLHKMEAGNLATRRSLAALGGIETVWEGIKGVKEGRFPGKTVAYPQIRGLRLQEPPELEKDCPAAAAALEEGGVWTNAAEEALLEARLDL